LSPPNDTPPTRDRTNRGWKLPLSAAAVSIVVLVLLFEAFCQVYGRWMVFPRLEARRDHPRHYYQRSEDPVLGYELRPGAEVMYGHKFLRINRHGIRDDSDDLAEGKRRVALLGDSVVFGVNHSQPVTIGGMVQTALDPTGDRVKVMSFAVGGYELDQLLAQLRAKNAIYEVDDVVYLLNFHDFARRDSIYEGADNGMYRSYVRPKIMGLFFVRKAVYRFMKGEKNGSVGWYRWMFDGNERRGQEILTEMARLGEVEGFRFGVVLLPSGLSYTDDGYGLADVHERLSGFLAEAGISYLDPVDVFGQDIAAYYDPTDHFHEAGNRKMAELIAAFVERDLSPAE